MSERRNVLYLVHRVPYPPNRGDRIRSYHLLNYLSQRANVYLATLADEPLEPGTLEVLQSRCAGVAVESVTSLRWLQGAVHLLRGKSATEGLFASSPLRAQIKAWTNQITFDAAVVFCSSMVQYLQAPQLAQVPTIVDLVDVDSQKFYDYAAASRGIKRWLYQWEGSRLRALECSLPAHVKAITLVSEAEANIFREFCPNTQTHAVKNGVDLAYFQPSARAPQPQRCVFVGAFDYRPNIDGAVWFCHEIWPQVKSQFPAATLALVGRKPDPAVQKLAAIPGVEVIGSVPDVRPHVAQAEVVVVPLRIARGIQNKVLEAMAMRKPVLASAQAMEGLTVQPGQEIAVAQTTMQWIEQLAALFQNAERRQQLAAAGEAYVQREHDWGSCLHPFDTLLNLTADEPRLVSECSTSTRTHC